MKLREGVCRGLDIREVRDTLAYKGLSLSCNIRFHGSLPSSRSCLLGVCGKLGIVMG